MRLNLRAAGLKGRVESIHRWTWVFSHKGNGLSLGEKSLCGVCGGFVTDERKKQDKAGDCC